VQVGELQVTPVLDGRFELPATLFFPKTYEEDWEPHRRFLNEDGMLPLDVGGFLVRDGRRTVLVDAGVGRPVPGPTFGGFLENLAAQGVQPADVRPLVLRGADGAADIRSFGMGRERCQCCGGYECFGDQFHL
jgi:hypothetical protein